MDFSEIVLRLVGAAFIGCTIGFNRDLHGKPTGIRTLGLLAAGAAAIVVGAHDLTGHVSTDPNVISRVVQGVLTGIGFLGAGVIIHTPTEHRVRGLTTATCVWLTACIGLICGTGSFRVLSVLSPIVMVLLLFGGWVERRLHGAWMETSDVEAESTSDK
jgi:putative Mg2+ transporter-C (MgtC) family protein